MPQTKYGVISDLHIDPRIIIPTIKILKQKGAAKLLVNGDIGGHYGSLENSQQYTAAILNEIGKSGLESFVQPGSHETILGYDPVINHFSVKYPNIIDALKNSKMQNPDHHLVFLPGSDFLCDGEYQIGHDQKIPSGKYIILEDKLIPMSTLDQYVVMLSDETTREKIKGAMQYTNMNVLKKLVTQPEKTIVVCHVPRKFDNPQTGVDMAHFYESRVYQRGKKEYISRGVFPAVAFDKRIARQNNTLVYSKEQSDEHINADIKEKLYRAGCDAATILVERKENRGNENLRQLYTELEITKAVSGHFHESSHQAHDSKGIPVAQNTLTENLFWNSGHLDAGHCGILTVEKNKVSYENVIIQK